MRVLLLLFVLLDSILVFYRSIVSLSDLTFSLPTNKQIRPSWMISVNSFRWAYFSGGAYELAVFFLFTLLFIFCGVLLLIPSEAISVFSFILDVVISSSFVFSFVCGVLFPLYSNAVNMRVVCQNKAGIKTIRQQGNCSKFKRNAQFALNITHSSPTLALNGKPV